MRSYYSWATLHLTLLRAACCVLRAGHVHCKVYNDFFQYKSGVYNGCSPPANQSRKIAGYHAIKIVGWGSTDIDPVLDYWYECTRAFCAAVCNPFIPRNVAGRGGWAGGEVGGEGA